MNQAEVKRRQVGALSEILMMVTIYVIGNLIGNNGIIYVAVSVEICVIVGELINGGVSDGLGKLLRRRRKKGQYKNAHRMRKCAILFQVITAAVLSVLVFAVAHVLAENVIQMKYCTLLLRVLSPIILLRAVTMVLQGYCQGEGLELPTAIVGILRQFLILVFSFLFVEKLSDYGSKVSKLLLQDNYAGMYSGLGVVIAILLAELLCIVFLLLIYRITRAAVRKDRQEGMQSMDSYPDCIRGIWLGRWPMAVMNALLCVPLLVAVTCMCRAHLEEYRNLCYGFFIGKYAVVCGVLIALLVILVLPSIGKTFAFIRREDKRYAKAAFGAGAHISMVHGIFLSVFVTVMGPQLAEIFAKEETELLCKLFQLGGSIILVGVLCRYFGRFLTAAGKWIHMLGAVLVTVVLSSVFLGITMRMYGDIPRLLLGVVGGMYLLALLLGVFAFRLMKMRMDWLRMLVIPAGTGILTGLLAFGLGKVFTPHLGNLMTVFVAFAITFLVYWVLLLLFRNFREQELDVIAGGHLIHNLGQILRVF